MAVLMLGHGARMASGEAPPACAIEAAANFSSRRIVGTATFDFHNTSTNSVNELRVVAYPNRYDSDGTEIPHDLFDRVFPSGPSPARLTIRAVRADGLPCDMNPAGAQGIGPGVLHAAALPTGIQPGGRVSVEMDFETLIPKRFGTFGSHDGTVCLNGGWYPYLAVLRSDGTWDAHAPPPRSEFRVRLTVEDGRGRLFVNNRPFDVAEPGAIVETGTEAGYLTLVYYAESREERLLHNAVDVRYVSRHPRPDVARELSEAVARAVEDVRTIRPEISRPEIVLLEVPLRRDLVMPGDGVVLVSDRIRQVFGPLRDYHFAPLIEAVYARLLTPPRARDGETAFPWETEAAAWLQAKEYWKTYSRRSSTIDTYLRPFGFIPIVDAFRVAPRFPFAGAFFGDVYAADPLREDILRFNRRTAHGRILAEKLRDLLGEERLAKVRVEAVRGGGDLAALAEAEWGQPLGEYLDQWTDPYPAVNYSIDGWTRSRTTNGTTRATVSIRQTGAPVQEPVTVELRRWFGPSHRGTWSGEGENGVAVIESPSPPHRVILDPDRRLRETTRSDNRHPPGVKLLVDNFRLHIDANGRDHEGRLGGSVIVGNNYRHRYRFNVYSEQEGDGVEFKYVHAFGGSFDAIQFRNSVTVGCVFDSLSSSFSTPESGYEDSSGRLAALTLGYEIRTTESRRNRLDGMTLLLEGEAGDTWLGGDFRYWKAKASADGVIPLARDRHLLALRGNVGASDPDGTPTQVLFDAGGYDAVRGINRGTILGNYRWLGTVEYRWILCREVNFRLLSLLWLRSVQTATYVDVGNVSATSDGLFDGDNVHCGVGVGLRLHVDLLGVNPSVIRFDVAERVDRDSGEKRPMFHIGVGQSF